MRHTPNSGHPDASVVVYTAVFGGRDLLMPAPRLPSVRFVCFTDDASLVVPGWEIRVETGTGGSARRAAKRFKVLPHRYFPDADCSIWTDATHVLRRPPESLVEHVRDREVAAYAHPQRSCAYDEARACIAAGFDPGPIRMQVDRYQGEGYPAQCGLAQCTVLVRRHNAPAIVTAMETWWREIESGSERDQISFNYALWKTGVGWVTLPGNVYFNELFWYTPHGRRPSRLRSLLESKRAAPTGAWGPVLRIKDRLAGLRDRLARPLRSGRREPQ